MGYCYIKQHIKCKHRPDEIVPVETKLDDVYIERSCDAAEVVVGAWCAEWGKRKEIVLMPKSKVKSKRDIEKGYTTKQFVAKLRRLADCIEKGKMFRIQISGKRIAVPSDAVFAIEHERGDGEEEIEF